MSSGVISGEDGGMSHICQMQRVAARASPALISHTAALETHNKALSSSIVLIIGSGRQHAPSESKRERSPVWRCRSREGSRALVKFRLWGF